MIFGNKSQLKTKTAIALAVAASLGLTACNSDNNDKKNHKDQIKLRVMETSDLHTNIMDYNYYKDAEDQTIGLARVASIVKSARAEVKNSVLVDNGDLLQGSPMGDYMADEFKKNNNALTDTHPAYKAMNLLDYDVGNIGNHEFNFGLEFLDQSIAGANFPYINSNVICDTNCGNDELDKYDNRFTPYIIKEKVVVDTDGDEHKIKVGYIGFVPPQIMLWDAKNLAGRVEANSIIESAKIYVPQMKAEGADIIVAIPHSGIGNPDDKNPDMENAVYKLTQVDGIDAVMFGHSHQVFPSEKYADLENADIEKGTINGTASVMPGRWGDNLGIVDLVLEKDGDSWTVVDSQSSTRAIFDANEKTPLVTVDKDIHDAVELEHKGTRAYVNAPIGKASANMYSFLSMAQDDPTVQIVADAQMWYAQDKLPENLKSLPILSAAAPFKAGGRYSDSDSDQYVQVDKGNLAIKDAADLYLYPNTMVALKITGNELKEWLECSANQYNQIDPAKTEMQQLINRDGHPTYNFDSIDGVTYKIDVTKPSNYDRDCVAQDITGGSQRIIDLEYQDQPVTADQEFVVITNNYRGFGGKFAGTGADYIVHDFAVENRQVLTDYIKEKSEFDPKTGESAKEINTEANYNWNFKNIDSSVELNVTFETQDSEKTHNFVEANKRRAMEKLAVEDTVPGFAIYSIDMTQELED
ncbi:bifunctional 2',3'-cyclic-nucleotide 2'-phosphodiesterase/3'-nucleotidase [Parashewanella spongiae]|uniref:Bifunctional 2',3'-cyclic-nucleotide 2'-phosphodiesterase/3'-nucleotidase n=1 Tax=Parashewanella spongiae TaxID=342950 RepID=A0A3A6TCW2_9GAMM|nr:bifunctional 2',3'-cyclic-nucleotide 2'-phosphodiesterase/3'-nucleotidase [Parashewanella spongiae]MCL1080045.1 bifunctional 2',3'-cyclic-nucleotide 2'-phosphodiesterase/3'-nucleotidase [Parashewanella spongiae]RJY05847.1 bifunctional 2',3'-cyclic-nucleotide 2'-phosphodiesterase/3'-nucleotidase [Parashewanella spongiae]